MPAEPTPVGSDQQDAVFDYGVDDRDGDVVDLELALGEDGEQDVADGWVPPDTPLGAADHGITVDEQRAGESLDERELRVLPDRAERAHRFDGRAGLPAEEAAIHRIDPAVDTPADLAETADGGFPEDYAVDEGRTAG